MHFITVIRQFVVDQTVRTNLEKWLQPASVAVSQRDAANKRHRGTGNWLFERSEFIEWIYAPSSLLWLHGICALFDLWTRRYLLNFAGQQDRGRLF
jgi:hypothetical protein